MTRGSTGAALARQVWLAHTVPSLGACEPAIQGAATNELVLVLDAADGGVRSGLGPYLLYQQPARSWVTRRQRFTNGAPLPVDGATGMRRPLTLYERHRTYL